jgi:DNA polymerase-3 subunit gamma/tau
VDTRARDQARQSIRPTREDGRPADPGSDERDEAVSRDDDVLDDATESHRDLLTRHLGAEIISEEEPDT